MIVWAETEELFGYSEQTAKSRDIVVVACDDCGVRSHKRHSYHQARMKLRGHFLCLRCATSSPSFRAKSSATNLRRWTDADCRAKTVAGIKHSLSSPVVRAEMSARTKQSLGDPEILVRRLVAARNPTNRARLATLGRRRFSDKPELREQWRVMGRASMANPATRKKYEAACETAKHRHSAATRLAMQRAEVRAKLLALWQRDDYCEQFSRHLSQRNRPPATQLALYDFLDILGVSYVKEGPQTCVGRYVFDCLIPATPQMARSLFVECQGSYYHDYFPNARRDRAKFAYINKYYPQYEIMYIWDYEFNTKERVLDRLKLKLGLEIETVYFRFDELLINEIRSPMARAFLERYHYLGKDRGGKSIGCFHGDKLIAVCVYSPPVRQNQHSVFGSKFVELSRLCIHPSYHKKNFASWFVTRSLRYCPGGLVIAYADETVGHKGIVYKACGFHEHHRARADYWYVDADGYVMSKKKLYNAARKDSMQEAQYAACHGYIKKFGGEKICFVKER